MMPNSRPYGVRKLMWILRQPLLKKTWHVFDKTMPVVITGFFLVSLVGCVPKQKEYVPAPLLLPSELTELYVPNALPERELLQSDVEDAYLDLLALVEKGNEDKISIKKLIDEFNAKVRSK